MEISIIPSCLIRYLSKNYYRQNDLNILLSNILIILFFIFFRNKLIDFLNFIPHFCLFDKLFKIECPVCGITRAFCELTKGNIIKAYYLNFTSIFIASFFIFQIPLRLFSLIKENVNTKVNLLSKYFGNIIVFLIITIWVVKLILIHFYK